MILCVPMTACKTSFLAGQRHHQPEASDTPKIEPVVMFYSSVCRLSTLDLLPNASNRFRTLLAFMRCAQLGRDTGR